MVKEEPLEKIVKDAQEFIAERGVCLLLFDVNHSRYHPDRYGLQEKLLKMMDDLNHEFDAYFPKHDLAIRSRKEKGFEYLLGDGSWAGVNSADVIPEIIEYQRTHYPDIDLRWGVARDGYDDSRTKIVL